MGYRPLRSLIDYMREGCWVQIDCRCGHVVKVDPAHLREQLAHSGHSTTIAAACRHLKCSRCGARDPEAMPCQEPARE